MDRLEVRGYLGEYLVKIGRITPEDLDYALQVQKQSGSRLGSILLSLSMVTREDLYKALSTLWGIPYVRLDDLPPATDFRWPITEAVSRQAVLIRQKPINILEVATAEIPGPSLGLAFARYFPGCQISYNVTTHWDIDQYIRRSYRQIILDHSIYGLYKKNRISSAYTVLTLRQFIFFVAIFFMLFLSLLLFTVKTLIFINIVITIIYLINVLFKFWIGMVGSSSERDIYVSDQEVAELKDEELPFYTILVPVYRESNIVHQVMEHVVAVDYPSGKLEILILIEEDDDETWLAAKQAEPPDFVHLIRIPHALPKTKPKACNVGLSFARGDYLVIYDAEDIPDVDQLKKALVAFKKGGPKLVCIQAALNYFNHSENWLTRMFTLEYSYWFDYVLPGLKKLNLPIPLGGTSNHFRVDLLRELAGWDPFNVTEDADLGIRASTQGYEVGIVNSTTMEEANNHLPNWIRQRSRWIKGYMQTALVHTRNPLHLFKTVGIRQSLGFALLIGGTPLALLAYLPSLCVYIFWIITGTHAIDEYFPPWVLYMGLFNFLIGNALGIYFSMLAVFKRQKYNLLIYCLFNPVYWMLQSIAAYKAFFQLISKPFFWEKTVHGISKRKPAKQ